MTEAQLGLQMEATLVDKPIANAAGFGGNIMNMPTTGITSTEMPGSIVDERPASVDEISARNGLPVYTAEGSTDLSINGNYNGAAEAPQTKTEKPHSFLKTLSKKAGKVAVATVAALGLSSATPNNETDKISPLTKITQNFGTETTEAATKKSHKITTSKVKVTQYPNGVIVTAKVKAKGTAVSRKLEKCFSDARREEQQPRPADPLSSCKGNIKVTLSSEANAKCAPGWFGGKAKAKATIKENVIVRAFSQSLARGNARTRAITRVIDRISLKTSAEVDCHKDIPNPAPQQPQQPQQPQPTPEQPTPQQPTPEQSCAGGMITIENKKEHVYSNGQVVYNLKVTDPDTPIDRLRMNVTASRGTVSAIRPKKDENGNVIPGYFEVTYTADGTSGGQDELKATASDGVDDKCRDDNYAIDGQDSDVFDRPEDQFPV